MQQSLIKIYKNNNGDTVLAYADSGLFDANDAIKSQSIVISSDDLPKVIDMLKQYSDRNL